MTSTSSSDPKSTVAIRELRSEDRIEFISLLSHLTAAPPLDDATFDQILSQRSDYGMVTLVATSSSSPTATSPTNTVGEGEPVETATSPTRVAGTVSLFFERKFTRGGAIVAHMEDVVSHPDFRGQGIASALIKAAAGVAKDKGCYKMILDCTEGNATFYEKFGFCKKELQMRLDL